MQLDQQPAHPYTTRPILTHLGEDGGNPLPTRATTRPHPIKRPPLLPLAVTLASVATAQVAVRIEARSARVEGGTLTLPADAPPPRARACSTRDPAPPGCRLVIYDLP